MKLKKHIVLFFITAFTLATISTLIGCDKQLLIMKMDDMKEPEKESTQITGVGELGPGGLYTFGTIIIQYDKETWEQAYKKYTPITTVNDFLVSKGYTPTVRSVLPGRRIEVIDIAEYGGSIWSSRAWLLLEELQTVPGVVTAERSVVEVHRFSDVLDQLYRPPETIMIQYDEETWEQRNKKHTPITTVNDFLVSKGYTPTVRGILNRIEVIDIGKNIDTLPLLEELQTVRGVVTAELNFLHQYADWLTGMSRSVKESELITANKVGKMVNGQLFEFGLLLVTFEEKHLEMRSAPAVAVLQFLSDKGYKPIVRETWSIDIGENINPLPLIVELRAITGVSNVELNALYESADVLLGTIIMVNPLEPFNPFIPFRYRSFY